MLSKKDRIGEKLRMKNGMYATIIKYSNNKDIDIEFEDKTIIKHRMYRDFANGVIKHPNISTKNILAKDKYLGMKRKMNNGMYATIVDYNDRSNLTVEFEDGTIRENIHLSAFLKGKILNENIGHSLCLKYKELRIGETNIANNGQTMEIIDYKDCYNCSIQFEDNTIVKNISYESFKNGRVVNPNCRIINGVSYNELFCLFYLSKFGFKKSYKNELEELNGLELDLYNSNLNGYKVAIEYDGFGLWDNNSHTFEKDIRKNKLCKDNDIILYRIREQQLPVLDSTSIDFVLTNSKHASKSLRSILELIVEDINKKCNCDFKLEINWEKDKEEFKKFISKYHNPNQNRWIGETRIMNNGLKAKIINYRFYDDVDIEFEDKTVVYHKDTYKFMCGNIGHPKYRRRLIKQSA